ncbi:MAG: RsmD family RNA methyltransferase [Planctomycetota bacterium]|nr:RsmD family RNA methyltransferase [Planctomycetota bacterium]
MRVIGGTHRGRRLAAPPGRGTRPMLDRVREAIFNRLAPWFGPGEEPRVLDLFAGSGSLGIEALSRGAAFARFVERGREAGATLRGNLESLDLADRAELLASDALGTTAREPGPWDVCFYDPPYPLLAEPESRKAVLDTATAIVRGPLAPDGVFVLHTPGGSVAGPDLAPDLEAALKTYGTTDIWFLGRSE